MSRISFLILWILIGSVAVFADKTDAVPASDPGWTFNAGTQFSRWEHRDMTELAFDEEGASFVSGRDSSIVSPGVSFSAEEFPICEIVLTADKAAHGELFFLLAGEKGFSQKKSLSFPIAPSGDYQTFRLDCRRNPLWKGTIIRLRLDPVSSSGVKVRLKSIRMVSPENAELLSAEYVGMASAEGTDDDAYRQTTLTGVSQPPVKFGQKLPNQLGYAGPIHELPSRISREIPAGNIFGVAINGDDFFANSPEVKGALWSSCWLNDGEKLAGVHNTVFSSAMHYTEAEEEWCMIELPEAEEISRIVLQPRNSSHLGGFPVDFHILRSTDGKEWEKVVDVKECREFPADRKEFAFEVSPRPTRFVKVVATRLRPEGERRHYFQLREIELFGEDGVNYAHVDRGGIASAGNPLGSGSFDYEEYYNNIFESGATWVFVSNSGFLSRHRAGKAPCTDTELDNAEYLKKNNVNLIYRFILLPPLAEFRADPAGVAAEYADAVGAVAEQLRGKVATWALANEQNFHGDAYRGAALDELRNYYVTLVGAAAERIREIDPDTPIEIETALFDFGWTDAVLSAGLAEKIDRIGVHVYKELRGRDTFPEAAGAISRNGKRSYTEPWRNYEEQIAAFRELLRKHNPLLEINVSETGVNTGVNPAGGAYYVSELSQAKFLSRLYTFHQLHGIGPTCWWSLEPVRTGEYQWGLIRPDGSRKGAWYALRNVAAVFDNSCRLVYDVALRVDGKVENLICGILRNDDSGEYLIPCWSGVKMRDGNTGVAVDLILSGRDFQEAEVIDLLTGTVHPAKLEREQDGGQEVLRLKDMVLRDYPIVLRLR